MSSVPEAEFIFLNAAGDLVWAAAVGTGGYLFCSALEILIGNIKHYEIQEVGAIAAIGVLIWAVYFYRCKKRKPALMKSY